MLSISKNSVNKMIVRHKENLFALYATLGTNNDYISELCEAAKITKRQLAVTVAIANNVTMKELADMINVDYSTIRRWPEIRRIYLKDEGNPDSKDNYYSNNNEYDFEE